MTSGFETVTVVGGVTYIGEIKHTKKGASVLNLSVAVSKDRYIPEENRWEQGGAGTYYESVTIFGPAAEKAKNTFSKGDLIIVVGERNPKPDWTDKDGNEHKHESQITAKYVGVGLLFNDVKIDRKRHNDSDSKNSTSVRSNSEPAAKSQVDDDSYDEDPLDDDDDETDDW